MSIRDRAAAWWSAWKYVAILGLALAGSMALNLHLYVSKQVELATAPLKDRVASQEQALNDSAALQATDAARAATLAKAADRATANLNASSDDWRAAARARPLAPNCAPGQGRKDAVNRALGAPTQEK